MSQATIDICQCCGYNGEVKPYTSMREYDIRNGEPASTKMLCRACSHTHIGNSWAFPTQSAPGVIALGQAVAWLYNDLMRELKELRNDLMQELKTKV